MIAACNGYITTLPSQWEHDPTLSDKNDWTVAMYAVRYGHISTLPPQWDHDPTLRNNDDMTVAMIAVQYGYDVPE